MTAKRTAKPKASAPASEGPNRARAEQVSARLSDEEKANLDAVVQAWEEQGEAAGFPAKGFNRWLVAIITREAAALKGAKPARKPSK
jgi:hypothetical protein